MKILIAPDKFKGSLSAREVAENIAAGLRDVLPGAKIDMVPMADGGEGTAEVIGDARDVWIGHRKFAVMEMSEAAGMRRLSAGERDPLRANTFGVGEMLIAAARRGADQIIIGLGGSATNDGGFGMARALGFRFFEQDKKEGQELRGAVSELTKLARIDRARNLSLPKIVAAVDVRNPLLGRNGATQIFGPQKGASEKTLDTLERGLARLAEIVATDLKVDYRDE